MPKVSVFVPVFNGEKYIGKAIQGILNQTDQDFEIIIVNDGSTDNTLLEIDKFTDPRIKVYNNPKNLGLAATRNRGLELANAKYLAINDCDDISYPTRLEEQLAFLDTHKEVGIVGSNARRIFPDGSFKIWSYPKTSEAIKCRLFWGSAVINSSAVLRLDALQEHKLSYREEFPPCEDYDLFERAQHCFKIENMDKVLVDYLEHSNNVTFTMSDRSKFASNRIGYRQLERLGIPLTDQVERIHKIILNCAFDNDYHTILEINSLLETLMKKNNDCQLYDLEIFNKQLAERWFLVCYHSQLKQAKNLYYKSFLSGFYPMRFKEKIKFTIKNIKG